MSTIVCNSSGVIDCIPIKSKTDALCHMANFLEAHPYITMVRVDNGGELVSEGFKAMLCKRGVGHQTCAPGASSSMGKVEKAHDLVKKKISMLLIDLGLEQRAELWPWLCEASCEALNATASAGADSSAFQRRNDILVSLEYPKRLMHSHGFGDVVWFKTPRELTAKERDKLPSQHRKGLYLATHHSGSCSVLGFQNERATVWNVHPRQVSTAPPSSAAEFRHSLLYYVLGFDDKD